MVNLPRTVQQEIKKAVYKKADDHGYLKRDRIANGQFIRNLVKDKQVGVRLAEFIPKADIRTYIKDGVLNAYSKEKLRIPQDVSALLSAALKTKVTEFEHVPKNHVSIYKTEEGKYVVAARGTYLKWETALRKALEFVQGAPGLEIGKTQIVLILSVQTNILPKSDRDFLESALSGVGVVPVFYECCG